VTLNIAPEVVEVSKDETNKVYGVLMDYGLIDQQRMVNWVISMSAFPTGEASFRPSVGGGMIGLGGDPEVAQVAKDIVAYAQTLLSQSKPTKDFSLPSPGEVRFILLTTNGMHVIEGHLNDMQFPGHVGLKLLNQFGFIRQFADNQLDKN
jgi:hypothetical protein